MSRVAIIGGGASGFAVARALLEEPREFEIHVFESQEAFGGLWHYVKGNGPMYRDLDSNVPRPLMGFVDRPFPESPSTYMTRSEVEDYLNDYCREIANHPRVTVHFGALVNSVDKDSHTNEWTVEHSSGPVFRSDFVLIATGHYHYPIWPDIKNIHSHPGLSHSVDYDNPEEFRNQRVLIIGNATSGTDLAIQILSQTNALTISRKRELPTDSLFDGGGDVVWKPEADEVTGRTVKFSDGTESEFDRIIACTGYSYNFPYLTYNGEPSLPIQHPQRARICNFYKHTFYSGDERLATVGMNRYMVPFPTFEAQGAVIARVWSGRLVLPSIEDRIAYEQEVLELKGDNPGFHGLPMEEDLIFMKDLWSWAEQAPDGFQAEKWSPEKQQIRLEVQGLKMEDNASKLAISRKIREELQAISSTTETGGKPFSEQVGRKNDTLVAA